MWLQMYLGIRAGVRQLPHFTPPVAEWAHDRVGVADLLSVTRQRVERAHGRDTDTVGPRGRSHERRAVEEGQAIKEDYDPNESGRDEEIRVPAQPQVVQGHLLPKVVPDRRRESRSHTPYVFLMRPIRAQMWTVCFFRFTR